MKLFRLMLVGAGMFVLCSCTSQGSQQKEVVTDSVSVSQVDPVIEILVVYLLNRIFSLASISCVMLSRSYSGFHPHSSRAQVSSSEFGHDSAIA